MLTFCYNNTCHYGLRKILHKSCISETSFAKVDFKDCYKKVQTFLETDKNIIIVIIDKKINNINRPKVSTYSMMDPFSGKILEIENICKGDLMNVNENLTSLLANL